MKTALALFLILTQTASAAFLGNPQKLTHGGTQTSTTFTAGSLVFAGTSGVYSQDNSNIFWDDTNNRIGIGSTAPDLPLTVTATSGSGTASLNGDGVASLVQQSRYTANASGNTYAMRKSRGSLASPAAVATADAIGDINFQAYDGGTFRTGAQFRAFVDTYTGSDDFSTYLTFLTRAGGSGVGAAEKMRLSKEGFLGIGTTGPSAPLHITKTDTTANVKITDSTNGGKIRFQGPNAIADLGITSGDLFQLGPTGAFDMNLRTNGQTRMTVASGGDVSIDQGNLLVATAGKGLSIKTGSNARAGTATLVAGTVTVSNTSVGANTLIFYSVKTAGGTQGILSTTQSNGTSFTINSTSALDTSSVAWMLVEAP